MKLGPKNNSYKPGLQRILPDPSQKKSFSLNNSQTSTPVRKIEFGPYIRLALVVLGISGLFYFGFNNLERISYQVSRPIDYINTNLSSFISEVKISFNKKRLGFLNFIGLNKSEKETAKNVQPIYLGQINPLEKPAMYFIDSWSYPLKNKSFKVNGTVCNHGVAFFIQPKKMKGRKATQYLVYDLSNKYNTLTFTLASDQNWCFGKKYGKFSIRIYVDDTLQYDSGLQDYKFTKTLSIPVANKNRLKVELTEIRGSKGTLNIVLANATLK